jgi:hypothetical protein
LVTATVVNFGRIATWSMLGFDCAEPLASNDALTRFYFVVLKQKQNFFNGTGVGPESPAPKVISMVINFNGSK